MPAWSEDRPKLAQMARSLTYPWMRRPRTGCIAGRAERRGV
jgi:hypothetical protein